MTDQEIILRAVRGAEPSKTGAVRLTEIMVAMGKMHVTMEYRQIDQALQRARRIGHLRYLERRHPETGEERKRWGWELTATGRRAA